MNKNYTTDICYKAVKRKQILQAESRTLFAKALITKANDFPSIFRGTDYSFDTIDALNECYFIIVTRVQNHFINVTLKM